MLFVHFLTPRLWINHLTLCLALLFGGCSSTPKNVVVTPTVDPSTAVTVETSGDLYHAPDGESYWVQFFGRCEKNETKVIVEANSLQAEAPCNNFQYRYTHKIPKNNVEGKNLFWVTKLQFHHPKQKNNQAVSWILFDTEKKVLKTVVNQQLRFERLPNGEFAPIVEFSALGTCNNLGKVSAKITGQGIYQQPITKYEDQKACQHGSFYFLSQMEGENLEGFKLEIQEQIPKDIGKAEIEVETGENPVDSQETAENSSQVRTPASEQEAAEEDSSAPRAPIFQWSMELQ